MVTPELPVGLTTKGASVLTIAGIDPIRLAALELAVQHGGDDPMAMAERFLAFLAPAPVQAVAPTPAPTSPPAPTPAPTPKPP